MAQGKKLELSIESLQEIAEEIKEIDTKIAAATGTDAAARKAVMEQAATEHSDDVDKEFKRIVAYFDKQENAALLVGLVSKVEQFLKEQLKERIDAYVEEQLKNQAGDKIDVEALREARKALVTKDQAVRSILTASGWDLSDAPESPKRSAGRGTSGGAGARSGKNKEGYVFYMDGKRRPSSQNALSSLAFYSTTHLNDAGEKVDDAKAHWTTERLKGFLGEQGVLYGEDDKWEISLPNGRKIAAVRSNYDSAPELWDPDYVSSDPIETGEDENGEGETNADTDAAEEPVGATT